MTRFTVGDGQNVVEHHVGRVDVSDGDKGDEVDLELQGADARAFHIFPSGDLIIAEPARLLERFAPGAGVAVDMAGLLAAALASSSSFFLAAAAAVR